VARSEDAVEADTLRDVAWDYNHEWIELLPPAGVYVDVATFDDGGILDDHPMETEGGASLSETERDVFTKARIGQGLFRENVIGVWALGEACAATGVTVREVLIASHIRPWRDCQTRHDRLSGGNGILLCAHLDKLFDAHLISFDDAGAIVVGQLIRTKYQHDETFRALGVDRRLRLNMSKLSPDKVTECRQYLVEHRARLR
jgi:predicted restriction endonuclease